MVPVRVTPVTVNTTVPRLSLDDAVNTTVPLLLVTDDAGASGVMPDQVPATVAPDTAFPAASTTFTVTDAEADRR